MFAPTSSWCSFGLGRHYYTDSIHLYLLVDGHPGTTQIPNLTEGLVAVVECLKKKRLRLNLAKLEVLWLWNALDQDRLPALNRVPLTPAQFIRTLDVTLEAQFTSTTRHLFLCLSQARHLAPFLSRPSNVGCRDISWKRNGAEPKQCASKMLLFLDNFVTCLHTSYCFSNAGISRSTFSLLLPVSPFSDSSWIICPNCCLVWLAMTSHMILLTAS